MLVVQHQMRDVAWAFWCLTFECASNEGAAVKKWSGGPALDWA